ncbi:MAG TPA: hypothetical protein VFX49_21180 [Chloroflexota bacterium]|nr:hypothetical protein [Chloroflexota bacterium]
MSATFKHTPPAVAEGGAAEVSWAPRISRTRLRRLYVRDSLGLVDDELIAEVGHALEARCESILAVHDARRGRVHCPRCARENQTRLLPHDGHLDSRVTCPACGWSTIWGAYQDTFLGKQLEAGETHGVYDAFIHAFRGAIGPRQKMLAIDRLIHQFHYSLVPRHTPARPAGVNLIEGSLEDVMTLLEELA